MRLREVDSSSGSKEVWPGGGGWKTEALALSVCGFCEDDIVCAVLGDCSVLCLRLRILALLVCVGEECADARCK